VTAPLTFFSEPLMPKKSFGGRRVHRFAEHTDECVEDVTEYCGHDDLACDNLHEADLISSIVRDEMNPFNSPHPWPAIHKPVIDIDGINMLLEPSGTAGNFHLYIDHEIEWPKYLKLLEAMTDCGLVQPGYLEAAKRRGYTSVRVPWKPKTP
jgi:hypothetical protein